MDRGLVELNSEECKRVRPLRGGVPAEMPAAGGRPKPLWLPSGRVPGAGCTGCGICFYACPSRAAYGY